MDQLEYMEASCCWLSNFVLCDVLCNIATLPLLPLWLAGPGRAVPAGVHGGLLVAAGVTATGLQSEGGVEGGKKGLMHGAVLVLVVCVALEGMSKKVHAHAYGG